MKELYDRIDRMNSLLAYYENENKRRDSFLVRESDACVSVSNIEADVLKFMSNNSKSQKVKDRIFDIERIREFISYSSTVAMRNESLIRECDKMQNTIMHLIDENKKLQTKIDQLYDFNGLRKGDI